MGDETDDSALWEKDREAEDASRPQQQDRADYLFQDNTPDTPSGTLAGTTTTQGTTRPGKVPGSILDIVGGDGSNADLIIGGGSQPGGTLPGGNPGTGDGPTPPRRGHPQRPRAPHPDPNAHADAYPNPAPDTRPHLQAGPGEQRRGRRKRGPHARAKAQLFRNSQRPGDAQGGTGRLRLG